jgi:hypothetical protein
MPSKIVRKTSLPFAGNQAASPAGYIGTFGSAAASAPAYSSDPAVIQSLAAYLNGWTGAVLGNQQPAIQDRNALDYLFAYFICYIQQQGVCEWDAGTTYFAGSWALDPAGTGNAYFSRTNNNLGNSIFNTTFWTPVSESITPPAVNAQSVTKAWGNFSGVLNVLLASYNVTSVTKIGTGIYQFNIPNGVITGAMAPFAWSQKAPSDPGISPEVAFWNGADILTPNQVVVRINDSANGFYYDTNSATMAVFSQ